MTPGIRLYVLDLGSIVLKPESAVAARSGVQPYRMPVSACLIAHPAGNVLFDTGMDPLTISDPSAVWGDLLDEFTPEMSPEDHIVSRLAAIGVTPGDVAFVVLSHLHSDHAGGICLFPEAEFIVQRAELETAVDEGSRSCYPESYRTPRLDGTLAECVRSVRLVDGDTDLLGDGRVMVISTPGHSPGHQSMVVRLNRMGDVLIAADAGCDRDQVNDSVVTDGDWCPAMVRRSMKRLREMRECCALTIYGHDPDLWLTLKRSPEYYE